MVDISFGKYRLHNITKINLAADTSAGESKFYTLPDSEGLAIEKQCDDNPEHYYVIATIENDEELTFVFNRWDDVDAFDWALFKTIANIGEEIIHTLNPNP